MKTRYKILITILIVALIDTLILFFIDNRHKNPQEIPVNSQEVIENQVEEEPENEVEEQTENTEQSEEQSEVKQESQSQQEQIPKDTQIVEPEIETDMNEVLEQKNNEEKALSLAKKEWGEDTSVYFTNEGKKDIYYIVAVRSKETTAAITYYKIHTDLETIEVDI